MNEVDQSLRRIHELGFEYGGGLTNHAPMAVEALHVLGHDALIDAFLDIYLPRLPLIGEKSSILLNDSTCALGAGRPEDWLEILGSEFGDASWQEILKQQLPRLTQGAFAGAMHGPIRVAHAVRALEEEASSERERELIFGLAYWSATFQPLPGRTGFASEAGRGPARVLGELKSVASEEGPRGLISDAARCVEGCPDFASAMERADLKCAPPSLWLSELCAEAAGLYLRNPDSRIAYLHGVTGVSALRLLTPYMGASLIEQAMGEALKCVATLRAVYLDVPLERALDPDWLRLSESWEEMRYRAACSLEEHVIKLTEVCWREDRFRSDERFRLAAADAILSLQCGE